MKRQPPDSEAQRELERWFCAPQHARRHATFETRRAASPDLRARYDALFSFLRELDDDLEVSPLELECVQARLFSSDSPKALAFGRAGEPLSGQRNARTWTWVAVLGFVTALLLVAVLPRLLPSDMDQALVPSRRGIAYVAPGSPLGVGQGLVARGGKSGQGLAVELFCDEALRAEGQSSSASPIRDASCSIDRELSFALRVENFDTQPEASSSRLMLFGVDEHGGLLYYFPTPADPGLPAVVSAEWTPVEHSVRLDVNHHEGTLRVIALWSTHDSSTQVVEEIHRALVGQLDLLDQLDPLDPDWTQLLPDALRAQVCPKGACASAHTKLLITPARNSP